MLLDRIESLIQEHFEKHELVLPQGGESEKLLSMVRDHGRIVESRYEPDAVYATVEVTPRFAEWLKQKKHMT